MNRYEEGIIEKITCFEDMDKNMLLENQDELIDKGIRGLTDAINSIDFLVTMNSCQGKLIPEEADNHCPVTYVDFYVLEHQYPLANLLMSLLVSKFVGSVECEMRFESDFDFIDENTVEDNGNVNFRYKIRFLQYHVYEDVIETVLEFRDGIE